MRDERDIQERDAERYHLEVSERSTVTNAVAVDNRVAGDTPRDRDAEQDPASVAPLGDPADEEHPTGDDSDTDSLPEGEVGRQRQHRDDQDDHGREAARDRIDEAQLGTGVGAGQQHEVDKLERHGPGQERSRRPLEIPAHGCGGGKHDRRGRKHDGAGDDRIGRAGEQDVPESVKQGCAQGEEERRHRHAARTIRRRLHRHVAYAAAVAIAHRSPGWGTLDRQVFRTACPSRRTSCRIATDAVPASTR
jgi:hypothetical protein